MEKANFQQNWMAYNWITVFGILKVSVKLLSILQHRNSEVAYFMLVKNSIMMIAVSFFKYFTQNRYGIMPNFFGDKKDIQKVRRSKQFKRTLINVCCGMLSLSKILKAKTHKEASDTIRDIVIKKLQFCSQRVRICARAFQKMKILKNIVRQKKALTDNRIIIVQKLYNFFLHEIKEDEDSKISV